MPLTALVDEALRISSLMAPETWAELKADAKAKRSAIMMRCHWPGIAETSAPGTPYFAHKPGGDGCSAGESREHLLAEAAIVDGIVSAGWAPETEARGDGWVADVLATNGAHRVVFEVQWSRQQFADYGARQAKYEESGITSVRGTSRTEPGAAGALAPDHERERADRLDRRRKPAASGGSDAAAHPSAAATRVRRRRGPGVRASQPHGMTATAVSARS